MYDDNVIDLRGYSQPTPRTTQSRYNMEHGVFRALPYRGNNYPDLEELKHTIPLNHSLQLGETVYDHAYRGWINIYKNKSSYSNPRLAIEGFNIYGTKIGHSDDYRTLLRRKLSALKTKEFRLLSHMRNARSSAAKKNYRIGIARVKTQQFKFKNKLSQF